jgi:hemerythrin-like domain-containing protein
MITISEVMAEDHAKTMRMINEFRTGWATIDQLRMALQRHFFLEEQAVFSFKKSNDPEDLDKAMQLVKEHNDLLDLLTEIEDATGGERKRLLEAFLHKLEEHSHFEDEEFYPGLDRNLSKSQKMKIISKVRAYASNTHDSARDYREKVAVKASIFTGMPEMNM